jgi:hypothetical protein
MHIFGHSYEPYTYSFDMYVLIFGKSPLILDPIIIYMYSICGDEI